MSELKTLTNEQIKNNPFVNANRQPAFYNLIRKLYKTNTHEIDTIDCTKINVATNIQETWFDYAKKHNIDQTDLAMGICFSGPKALDTLPDNTVEILDGCLTYKPIAETKITDRTDKPRRILCLNCGWKGYDTEITSEDENGFDLCPACNGINFEILE